MKVEHFRVPAIQAIAQKIEPDGQATIVAFGSLERSRAETSIIAVDKDGIFIEKPLGYFRALPEAQETEAPTFLGKFKK